MSENDSSSPQELDSELDSGCETTEAGGDPESIESPSGRSEDRHVGLSTQTQVLRLAGLGTELAGITLAFLGLGYVVDSALGNDTGYATALATLIGFTLGMIRFILQVRKINED